MKQYNKKLMFITIIICILSLSGCKSIRFDIIGNDKKSGDKITEQNNDEIKNEDETKQVEVEVTKKPEEVVTTKTDDNTKKADSTAMTIQPASNIELLIYTVNNDADIETVIAAIPEGKEITPQLIVDTVKDSMEDNSLMVGIESVTAKDDTVIVSFYKDQPPVANVGSGYETAILDAIAQSLTENLKDYKKVIYRIEGGAYVSGHIELGIDEVYLNE